MGYQLRMQQDPTEWPTSYRPQIEDSPGSFGTSIDVMNLIREVMEEAEVTEKRTPCPDLSALWEKTGLTDDRINQLSAHILDGEILESGPSASELERFVMARSRSVFAKAALGTVPNKVPLYKFSSNDGWYVSPEEAGLIARTLQTSSIDYAKVLSSWLGSVFDADVAREIVADWIEFNRVAASHGGYRVW